MRHALSAAGLCLGLTFAAPALAYDGPLLDSAGCPQDDVSIVVLGDSLADGLWGSFFRAFARCGTVEVHRGTTVSDGLTRTAPEEWVGRIAGPAEGADLIVVQMGANDIQNIREGTTRAVFGSPEWDAAYAARAESLGAALAATGADVVWLGLPIVGEARFEDSYRAITALQAAAAEKAGILFVDTHEPTTFGLGGFVMSAEVGGTLRQVRVTDQVHFTEIGYDVVAGLLSREVERIFLSAGREAAIDGLALQ
ncbi:GDSL-type esterase/lipase family protein [Wenxinia saemankumensis]|uniref:Uncharacterized protein n=1 Tax=Wenxinia saemankumensis TaxID=1447782 RepID=A0A1M6A9W5_9RHOB|nr:GDSL-type esterase/lipase family protein [Wenxinia saemankumensis]SHI33265.1 Protein of unknown function [Wenxinia saemankumensis]